MHQFNQARFVGETSRQRFVESRQTRSMLAGRRNAVAVGDLVRACHQFGSDDAVGATQIVG
jgi:hypothetical protein